MRKPASFSTAAISASDFPRALKFSMTGNMVA